MAMKVEGRGCICYFLNAKRARKYCVVIILALALAVLKEGPLYFHSYHYTVTKQI